MPFALTVSSRSVPSCPQSAMHGLGGLLLQQICAAGQAEVPYLWLLPLRCLSRQVSCSELMQVGASLRTPMAAMPTVMCDSCRVSLYCRVPVRLRRRM